MWLRSSHDDSKPPHNLEAEQCVLGTILLQESMLEKVIGLLSPDDFYRDAHKEIYAAMLGLLEKNEPQYLITVSNLLKERNKLERALSEVSREIGHERAEITKHYQGRR